MDYTNKLNVLKSMNQWCMWIREKRGDKKPSRVPYSLIKGFGNASADNLLTLSSFEDVIKALEKKRTNAVGVKYEGINFCIYNKEVIGIDIDYMGEQTQEHIDTIIEKFKGKTYVEHSPSGKGLRIFLKGKLKDDYKDTYYYKRKEFEIYDNKKFLSVTFNQIEGAVNDVCEAQEELNWFIETYMRKPSTEEKQIKRVVDNFKTIELDRNKVLDLLRNVGDTVANEVYHFLTVGYPEGNIDKSAIDMKCILKLGFYTQRNEDLTKEIMMSSALFRDKFVSNKTYLDRSIENAFSKINGAYSGKQEVQSYMIAKEKENLSKSIEVLNSTKKDVEIMTKRIIGKGDDDIICSVKPEVFYNVVSNLDLIEGFDGRTNLIDVMNTALAVKDDIFYVKYKTMKQYNVPFKNFVATEGWKTMGLKSLINTFLPIKVTYLVGKKFVTTDAFSYWLNHPKRRKATGFVFENSEKDVFPSINLFTGYAIDPEEGTPTRILNYIKDVIANGDEKKYLAIIDWCANVIQLEKNQTALVMVGKQGSGKSILIQAMEKIFGDDYAYISSDMEDITGKFNSSLQNKVFVGIEEVLIGADRNDKNKMKDLITRAKLNIELKGQNKQTIGNYTNFMAATNLEKAVSIDSDDRRYIILQVNNTYANDMEYFEPLLYDLGIRKIGEKKSQKDDPLFGKGLRQFLNYLLNWVVDFSRLNSLRTDNTMKIETIQRNLQPDHEFWLSLVNELGGIYSLRNGDDLTIVSDKDNNWTKATDIYACYHEYLTKLGKRPKTLTSFFIDFKKDFDLEDGKNFKRTSSGIYYSITTEKMIHIFTEKMGIMKQEVKEEPKQLQLNETKKEKEINFISEVDKMDNSAIYIMTKDAKSVVVYEQEIDKIMKDKKIKNKDLAIMIMAKVLTEAEYNGVTGYYYGTSGNKDDNSVGFAVLKTPYTEENKIHPNVECNKNLVYLSKNMELSENYGMGFIAKDDILEIKII